MPCNFSPNSTLNQKRKKKSKTKILTAVSKTSAK
uniref:Uncharacterized protein n=1 Tax=Anguilla anguilla TaxID=7936 RepID=A0A0E9QDX5_ANGAN